MKKFEKKLNGLLIGTVFPLLFGLLAVVAWYFLDGKESRAYIYLIAGLLPGIFLNLIYLKTWIKKRFDLPVWFITIIYLVYNIMVFGFFMGFPVFNVFMGLLAGFYYGHRMHYHGIRDRKRSRLINRVSFFTGVVMAFICLASGFLALANNEAAGMIENVLGLHFEVTRQMVWGIVLFGGLVLVAAEILITRITIIRTIGIYPSHSYPEASHT